MRKIDRESRFPVRYYPQPFEKPRKYGAKWGNWSWAGYAQNALRVCPGMQSFAHSDAS
jgi:hypothetical protein